VTSVRPRKIHWEVKGVLIICVKKTQNVCAFKKPAFIFAYKQRKMNTTAVLIARFQTPYLHTGHRSLLDAIVAKHHKVVVVLGVSPVKGSKRNPYDFYTRERMLKKTYPQLFVLPLADHASDAAWSASLDELLNSSFPSETFTLYGGRDSFIPYYSGTLPVQELPAQGEASATGIRSQCADQVLDSDDFRLGINYAYQNSYAKVYTTVDVALFKDERRYLLLGRKKGREGWRLPGGFSDVSDADFESAARRELREECGAIEVGALHYTGSAKIDDWRYRREEDKIITLLFAADWMYGEPRAADDLCEVKWWPVAQLEANPELVTPEHQPLIKLLFEKGKAKRYQPAKTSDHENN
jgi:bifunctional NMN adenylyltransferase/nudix hydrolase